MRSTARSVLAGACLLLGSAVALADSGGAEPVKVGMAERAAQPALAPMGLVVFCASNPAVCAETGERSRILIDVDSFLALDRVNRTVNAGIRLRKDRSKGALKDIWSLDPPSGDCEDFVLTKRQRLIEEGFPPSSLIIAVARTREGEAHAVLVVRTDAGDLVLDNRTNQIDNWDRTGLKLVKVQAPENPLRWFSL